MYQKVNIHQLPAAGYRPRFTVHDAGATIHDPRLPSFCSLSPGACPERSRRIPQSLSPSIPAFTPPPVFLPHPLLPASPSLLFYSLLATPYSLLLPTPRSLRDPTPHAVL
jgi:hypothetical protein